MDKLPVITASELRRLLIRYGCVERSVKGSHHKIFNPKTGRTSVIAVHGGRDLDRGAFDAILEQLGVEIEEFIEFMR
jgi:predicted RNA binding protein YcfA (HicA-like mRNA interferase family)